MTALPRLLPLAAAIALTLTATAAEDKVEHGFVSKVFKDADGTESKYVVFVPHAYQAEKAYPVVLFLHGSGSTGDDGKKPVNGIAVQIKRAEKEFPAIVPICGGDPKSAAKFKDLPCWCFHGDADPTVKVDLSREMVKALKAAGGDPKYTEYPGVGHNSWTQAYADKELYAWLWKQERK